MDTLEQFFNPLARRIEILHDRLHKIESTLRDYRPHTLKVGSRIIIPDSQPLNPVAGDIWLDGDDLYSVDSSGTIINLI